MNDARLGDFLAKLGVISPQQLHTAREAQAANGGKLASILNNMGFVSEEELARLAATALRLPYVPLEKIVIPKDLVAQLPRPQAKSVKGVLVKKEGKRFFLATCDPTNVQAFDELQFALGGRVFPVVAAELEVIRAIGHYYGERVIPDRPFDLPKSDTLSYDKPEVYDIKAARAAKTKIAQRVDLGASESAAHRKAAQDKLAAVASTIKKVPPAQAPAPAAAPQAAARPARPTLDIRDAAPAAAAPKAPPAPAKPSNAEARLAAAAASVDELPAIRDAGDLHAPPAEVEELEVLELAEEHAEVVGGDIVEDGVETAEAVNAEAEAAPAMSSTDLEQASQQAADDLIAMYGAMAFGVDLSAAKPREANPDADALAALLMGTLGATEQPKAADTPTEPNEIAKELAHLLLDQTDFTA